MLIWSSRQLRTETDCSALVFWLFCWWSSKILKLSQNKCFWTFTYFFYLTEFQLQLKHWKIPLLLPPRSFYPFIGILRACYLFYYIISTKYWSSWIYFIALQSWGFRIFSLLSRPFVRFIFHEQRVVLIPTSRWYQSMYDINLSMIGRCINQHF